MANTLYKAKISPEVDIELWDGSTSTFTRPNSTGGTDTLNVLQYPGVDVLNKYGGQTDTQIDNALSGIGTTNLAYVWLAPGTWTISNNSDWSAYSNVTFVIPPGAVLSRGANTITFGGPIQAGTYKIFSGTGNIEIPPIQEINVAWWGVSTGESAANNYDFMQYAINALAATGGTVRWDLLPIGTYTIDDQLEMTMPNSRYLSRAGVVIQQSTAAKYAIYAHGTDSGNKDDHVGIQGFDIDMNSKHTIGIYCQYLNDSYVRDCYVENATATDSIVIEDSTDTVEGYSSGTAILEVQIFS